MNVASSLTRKVVTTVPHEAPDSKCHWLLGAPLQVAEPSLPESLPVRVTLVWESRTLCIPRSRGAEWA